MKTRRGPSSDLARARAWATCHGGLGARRRWLALARSPAQPKIGELKNVENVKIESKVSREKRGEMPRKDAVRSQLGPKHQIGVLQ